MERYRALAQIEAELKIDERELDDPQKVKLACAYNDGIRDAIAAAQQHDQGAVERIAELERELARACRTLEKAGLTICADAAARALANSGGQ